MKKIISSTLATITAVTIPILSAIPLATAISLPIISSAPLSAQASPGVTPSGSISGNLSPGAQVTLQLQYPSSAQYSMIYGGIYDRQTGSWVLNMNGWQWTTNAGNPINGKAATLAGTIPSNQRADGNYWLAAIGAYWDWNSYSWQYSSWGLQPITISNTQSGLNSFNNFINQWVGSKYDGDGYPSWGPYQCTDWANFFIEKFGGGKASGYPGGVAKGGFSQGWANAVGGFMIYNSTTDPNSYPHAGDIVFWTNGSAGHVAVADVGSNFNELKVIEQNGGAGGNGLGTNAIRRKTYKYSDLGWVAGWVRISAIHKKIYGN